MINPEPEELTRGLPQNRGRDGEKTHTCGSERCTVWDGAPRAASIMCQDVSPLQLGARAF